MDIKDKNTTDVFKFSAHANFSDQISMWQVGNYEIYISSSGIGNASVSVYLDAWHTRAYGERVICFICSSVC